MLRRYWTWRATSWSERGGRKEKVSKNLVRRRGFGGQRHAPGTRIGKNKAQCFLSVPKPHG